MIDLNDPASVCRSLGYFLNYLGIIAPLVGLAWITWRIAR
jgi:hypothetical protein